MRISINSMFTGILIAVVMMLVANNYPKILVGVTKAGSIALPQANAAVDTSEDLYVEPVKPAPKKVVSLPSKVAQKLKPIAAQPKEEIIDYPVPKKYQKNPTILKKQIASKNTISIFEK